MFFALTKVINGIRLSSHLEPLLLPHTVIAIISATASKNPAHAAIRLALPRRISIRAVQRTNIKTASTHTLIFGCTKNQCFNPVILHFLALHSYVMSQSSIKSDFVKTFTA